MPRKVGLGPAVFKVELISSGVNILLIDDFTGLPLAQPDAKPVTLLPETVRAVAERERRLLLRDKLASLGITKHGYQPPDKPEPEPTKPFRRRL